MLTKITPEEFTRATVRKPGAYKKRNEERAKSGYYQRRRSELNPTRLRAICVDGEGYTQGKEHKYIYIAASSSDASHIGERFNPDGLTTLECFEFLASLPKNFIKVAFSFSYDINMMLKDLNIFQLWHLNEKGFVKYKGWRINWTPNKCFSVSWMGKTKKSCTVWDMFGFFQTSFVKTIWQWQVGTDEEIRLVADMKERRSDFTIDEIDRISFYCRLECKLGAQVFEKLLRNTQSVGLALRRYDGAGSVAAAILRKHSVAEYMHQQIRLPDEVICAGYYGGRFDLTTYGECGNAIQYDINSAYPYQALSLPCLSCSVWNYSRDYDPHAQWALWHVSWNIDESALWSPFPYRHNKHIFYLRNGSGWYWANEVRQAIALYPDAIQIREGYVLNQSCIHQPFSFISEYFERRRRLKEAGDLAQMVLKLGLNSIYGKLAQNAGRHIPQTQCLIWAGIITSNTRGMLLHAIRENPQSLLVATDAIISPGELSSIDCGDGLGQWERSYLRSLFIITNGVYQARGAKEDKHATRGVSLKDLYDPEQKVDHWALIRRRAQTESRFNYHVQTRRFIGLGKGLAQEPVLKDWRTWKLEDHGINYGKFPNKELRDGRLYPGINPWGDETSQPYDPSNYRQDDAPEVDRSVLNLLECEGADSTDAPMDRLGNIP